MYVFVDLVTEQRPRQLSKQPSLWVILQFSNNYNNIKTFIDIILSKLDNKVCQSKVDDFLDLIDINRFTAV